VIDDHAHPFATEPGPLDLASLTLDLVDDGQIEKRHATQGPTRLMQELLTVRLARRLGCDPDEVASARADAATDWGGYVSGLFQDAGIEAVLVDVGIWEGGAESLHRCAELSGAAMRPIHRIDPIVDRLIEAGAGAREIVEEVVTGMRAAVDSGAVGFKTILAYRTGLAVDPAADLAAAEASLRGDEPVRRRGKACRDLVLRTALGVAGELGTPFQVHTGFGDSDIRLADSNPLLLEELLRSEEGRSAPVVLIHGSYPWHEEQAFLAATKPNVYAELSLSNIFVPLTVADRLARILELAPAAKVLLGTDGHSEPESFWFAATLLREAWAEVRSRMSGARARESWLDEVESRIFERNARELYRL
jgi:predicted TIM-barrel fold metal-dependent hydrolase